MMVSRGLSTQMRGSKHTPGPQQKETHPGSSIATGMGSVSIHN